MSDQNDGHRLVREDVGEGRRPDGRDTARAKRYSKIRLALFLCGTVWSFVSLSWFGFSGTATRMRSATRERIPNRGLAMAAFFAVVAVLSWLVRLPLSYLGGYRVERSYGLTKQSGRDWF